MIISVVPFSTVCESTVVAITFTGSIVVVAIWVVVVGVPTLLMRLVHNTNSPAICKKTEKRSSQVADYFLDRSTDI